MPIFDRNNKRIYPPLTEEEKAALDKKNKKGKGTLDSLEQLKEELEAAEQEVATAKKVEKKEEVKQEASKTEEAAKTEEAKAEEPKVEEVKAEEPKSEAPKAEEPKLEEPKVVEEVKPEQPTKTVVMPTPQPWQRVSVENGKPKLVNQLVFLGKRMDYEVGMKHTYRFTNLNFSDGLNRIVTAKFPKEGIAGEQEIINYMGYTLEITKYGNSAVCRLTKDNEIILDYVSLATVIDVLQDLLNPGKECKITWGQIDQSIKLKRGLKSRIKQLDANDTPVSQRTRRTETASDAKDEKKQEAKEEPVAEEEVAPTSSETESQKSELEAPKAE